MLWFKYLSLQNVLTCNVCLFADLIAFNQQFDGKFYFISIIWSYVELVFENID